MVSSFVLLGNFAGDYDKTGHYAENAGTLLRPACLLGKRKINNFEGVRRSVWWLRRVSYEVLTT